MKQNYHSNSNCQRARQATDFLTGDSRGFRIAELDEHLHLCDACTEELFERRRVKKLLKRAVSGTDGAPAHLCLSIQNMIRGNEV